MKHLLSLLWLAVAISPAWATENIAPVDAAKLIGAGKATLVDVRESSELKASGKAAPAKWLAQSAVDSQSAVYQKFIATNDKSTTLIFYCRSGRRAADVARQFEKLGYKTMNMGGFDGWVAANLPVEKQ